MKISSAKGIIFSLFALLSSCSSKSTRLGDNQENFCSFLKPDIEAIHQSMEENLAVFRIDARRKKIEEIAYTQQLGRASHCTSNVQAIQILQEYFASFHDPHLRPWWDIPSNLTGLVNVSLGHQPIKMQWKLPPSFATGVYLRKMGNGYFVKNLDKSFSLDSVKIGDELLSCDGKTATQIMDNEILPYLSVSDKNAARYLFGASIFFRIDKDNASVSSCEFSSLQGKHYHIQLSWREVASSYLEQFHVKSNEPIYKLESIPHGHWVKLSSLAAYDEKSVALLKHFSEDAFKLRKDEILVLDLRGNGGGDSSWGDAWMKNLWGRSPNVPQKPDSILASAGNIGHYERLYGFKKNSGAFSTAENEKDFQSLLNLMHSHFNQLADGYNDDESKEENSHEQLRFHGKLYVVSDFGVFSSGELFLQKLLQMPKVIQIGIATNASTQSGDIRFDQTPHGLIFSIGTKVFRSIFINRNPGEPLMPKISIVQQPKIEFAGRDSMREQIEKLLEQRP